MDNKLGKERWLSPVGLALVQGWARNGFVDEQIAKRMGIARKTLWVWRGKNPELESAMRSGKEVADFAVESALYKSAIEGSITAQMFWLRNRKPAQWNKPTPLPEGNVNAGVQQQTLTELRQLLEMPVPTCER